MRTALRTVAAFLATLCVHLALQSASAQNQAANFAPNSNAIFVSPNCVGQSNCYQVYWDTWDDDRAADRSAIQHLFWRYGNGHL